MRRLLLAAVLAAFAGPGLAAPGGSGGSAGDQTVVTSITLAETIALVEAAGAVVTEQGFGEEGFSLNIQYASGLYGFVDGRECTGQGRAMACAELETGGVFTLDSEAEALRFERELSFIWVADHVEGAELTVWRRDCLHGGVTRAQVGHWITVMEEQLTAVSLAIWPEDDGTATRPGHGTVET